MMDRDRGKGVASDDNKVPAGEQETLLSIKLRRGFAAGKRGGPCTPSPAWKLEEDVGEKVDDVAGAVERLREAVGNRQSVSARKLGANLWDLQDLVPLEGMSRRSGRPHRLRGGGGGADLGEADRPQSACSLRRHVVPSLMEHHKSIKRKSNALKHASPADASSSMEVTPYNPAISSVGSLYPKEGNGDSGYCLKTSTELLKVLNRIWSLEEQNASNVSVVRSLKLELDHARACIQELMQEQKEHHCEMDELMNKVTEDKVLRKRKEKDRMKIAVQSIREELDDEKRLRRRSESLHRKLGKELTDTKTALSKALKDLESERSLNGLLEDLCDEFARGIGQYEKEIRDIRKYTKDCERKVDGLVLHISEVWLDERLQMQMAESCGEKPEKGAIISRLKEEILSFLRARRANSINGASEQQHHHHYHNLRRQSLESLHLNGAISAPHDIEDDDSIASDLHCFELNMDKTKEGIHGQSKSHCESSLESVRKSSSGKKIAGIRKAKEGLERQLEGMELGDAMNLKTDADSGEDAIFQKWTNSYGGQERNVGDMDSSNMLTLCSAKNILGTSSGCKVHHVNYQGETSQNKFSGKGYSLASSIPMQQWNYRGASVDPEISECSSKLPPGLKENTLKAKLLEARLEGRHARLRALKGT